MARPEYVHCVRTGLHEGQQPDTKSWCGRDTYREFAFTDAGHASLLARRQDRLLVCPECTAAIIKALTKQTWTPDPEDAPLGND